MFKQNPSFKISSANRVRSPNLASTYFRYAQRRINLLNTSSLELITSKRCSAVALSTVLPGLLQILI
uniref:Uncharacterized protein n=1 Tax=Rhizophora mucronata TaxID=61149 RepID=A0A2P2MYF2_RHIMU